MTMREIKFRAWDNVHKCFDKTVAANLLLQLHEPSEDVDKEYGKRFILNQFTGLKDKNGVEIYEGDVVLIDGYGRTIIIWNESVCAFQFAYDAIFKGTAIGGRVTNTLYGESEKYKIIGNIYQHPELINQK